MPMVVMGIIIMMMWTMVLVGPMQPCLWRGHELKWVLVAQIYAYNLSRMIVSIPSRTTFHE